MPVLRIDTHVKIMLMIPILILVVGYLSLGNRSPKLERTLAKLTGGDAVDCGVVPAVGDRSATDACAVAAVRSHRPFWARYEQVTYDFYCVEAFAGDRQGNTYQLSYSSDEPYGASSTRGTVGGWSGHPKIVLVHGKERLELADTHKLTELE